MTEPGSLDVGAIARALAAHAPHEVDVAPETRWAAVALVLRATERGVELLFIRRAERAGDPWSGHIAFPGGRRDAGDASLEHTAFRETFEEVGLDLARDGRCLGALDDLHPRSLRLPPIVVRPFVVELVRDAPIVPNAEVAEHFWVSLDWLAAAGSSVEREVAVPGVVMRVPAFQHGDAVIWGMTERIVSHFVALVRRPAE